MSEFAELAKLGQLQGVLFIFFCVFAFMGYVIFSLWKQNLKLTEQNQNLSELKAEVLKKNGELVTKMAIVETRQERILAENKDLKTQVDQLQELVTKFVGKNFNSNAN